MQQNRQPIPNPKRYQDNSQLRIQMTFIRKMIILNQLGPTTPTDIQGPKAGHCGAP